MLPMYGRQFSAIDRRLSGTRALQMSKQLSETPRLVQHAEWSRPPAAHRSKLWNSDAQAKARARMSLMEASYVHKGKHVGFIPTFNFFHVRIKKKHIFLLHILIK